jgi:hypothetical protein
MKYGLIITLLSTIASNACATAPRIYQTTEEKLETDGDITVQSHLVSYLPNSEKLDYPGYVIGIEKSPKTLINGQQIFKVKPQAGEGVDKDLKRIGDDAKLHFITQLYKYGDGGKINGNCAIYSLYQDNDSYDFYRKCANSANNPTLRDSFLASWDALDAMKKDLQEDPKNYTHTFIMIMGWNTPQVESYRNFNEIISNLELVHQGEDFRPLVIGITWPSFWESSWFDALYKGFSYRNKADDADEIGLTWLGVLLKDTISPLREAGIKTTLIAHSFGARAASMAVCVGPGIARTKEELYSKPTGLVDNFINLQGAYSINRFFSFDDDDWLNESISYPAKCPGAGQALFTASSGDEAVDAQLIAKVIGDEETFEKYENDKRAHEVFAFTHVDSDGNFNDAISIDKSKLLYVNASELIKYNMVSTGGGAHSDIYRKEISCMIKNFINNTKKCR